MHMWEQVKRVMVESAREVCGGTMWLGERTRLGSRCWQLSMKRQKKNVWKRTERRRERLKGV